jgi:hypothetical protein
LDYEIESEWVKFQINAIRARQMSSMRAELAERVEYIENQRKV